MGPFLINKSGFDAIFIALQLPSIRQTISKNKMKVRDKNGTLNQGLGGEVSCVKISLQTIQKCKGEGTRCEFFGEKRWCGY